MNKKRILYSVLIIFTAALAGAAVYMNSLLPIITGYAAKNLCSDVFVSGRQPENIESTDLNFSFIKFTRNNVDYNEKSVVSHFLWGKSKAIYREGFGVTLLRDVPEEKLRKAVYPVEKPEYLQDSIEWPMGNIIKGTDSTLKNPDALAKIAKNLIDNNAYGGNAFAFMVVHNGIPVAEAYKPQFSSKTRFLSWSVAKSFINALVGILVREGRINIYARADIDEWKNDDRSRITLNDLMQMQSGLRWNENYGNRSDVTVMLHCESDMGRYAYEQPLENPPGTKWYYSSGTTNIVSWLIKKKFTSDTAYYDFAHDSLFEKIGIEDAVFEVDPQGTIVGSSYLYLTARDYARFGLLYLNDGVFNGQRILPDGWVKYSTTPASESNGIFGSFFWLNSKGTIQSAPEDMFSCQGHDGQMIFIIPSKQLVVVEFGYSPKPDGEMDFNRLLKDILSAI
jgi:CubicO group peptidase (beta-lactamase class C family)